MLAKKNVTDVENFMNFIKVTQKKTTMALNLLKCLCMNQEIFLVVLKTYVKSV